MTTKQFLLALVVAALIAAGVEKILDSKTAQAASTGSSYQAQLMVAAPMYSDSVRANGIIGTSPLLAIANASTTSEHVYYHYDVVNTHASNKLCWGTVALAADCGASGLTCTAATTQGVLVSTTGGLVMPTQRVSRTIESTRRLCVVADASSTTYHIERFKIE